MPLWIWNGLWRRGRISEGRTDGPSGCFRPWFLGGAVFINGLYQLINFLISLDILKSGVII